MQLSNCPLGEFPKASTLQRLIQLAYSDSIPGLPPEGNTTAESYSLYVQTAGFGRSEIETCARLRLTLLKVSSLLSLLWGETRNTRLLSSIFHVTGWRAAICLHAGVKHCSRCLCGGFAFAESEAKCLFWILNTEKQARAFFPRALATAHLDCSVRETSDGSSWCGSDWLNASQSSFCSRSSVNTVYPWSDITQRLHNEYFASWLSPRWWQAN